MSLVTTRAIAVDPPARSETIAAMGRWGSGIVAIAALAGACGDNAGASVADAGAPPPDAVDAEVPAPACADPPLTIPTGVIMNSWAIAIGADGTTFISHSAMNEPGIHRWRPGTGLTTNWARLPGGILANRLALDPATGILYASNQDGLYELDGRATAPQPTLLVAGHARSVTVGPDGAIYYAHLEQSGQQMGEHVRRRLGAADEVITSAPFAEPYDLLFDTDGTLLVAALATQEVFRLTLDANGVEIARAVLAATPRRPYAIGRDATGRYYVQLTDRLLRYAPADVLVDPEELTNTAAYDLAFAKGYLGCSDLFLTGDPFALTTYPAGETGTP